MQRSEKIKVLLAALVLTAAVLMAYSNTFESELHLDDWVALIANPSIRHLSHLGAVFHPPDSSPTVGRPLLNLLFALNFAAGNTQPFGYHAVNLAIHICAALVLFGILRRSVLGWARGDSMLLALVATALWALHPLQTEAVTYISQRAESLVGLFFLLTLYCFIRGSGGPVVPLRFDAARIPPPRCDAWLMLSVIACSLGMAVKEVMITAPVVVLIYDRAFVAGSFRDALVRRRWYYAGLALCWLWLGFLLVSSHLFGRASIGYHGQVSALTYGLTELKAVALYAKLAVWPRPLVFDYGTELFSDRFYGSETVAFLLRQNILSAAVVLGLMAGVVLLWRRSPRVGVAAVAFFIVLAPTSSVVPVVAQPIAESRMYMPLAAVAAIVVTGAYSLGGRRGLIFCGLLAGILGVASFVRNRDYRTEEALWVDSLAKCPQNWRAHFNLGGEYVRKSGGGGKAITQFEQALRIRPDVPEVYNNLGCELGKIPGADAAAIAHFHRALQLRPDYAEAHYNLANKLAHMGGHLAEAIAEYRQALRSRPDYAPAHYGLAGVLGEMSGEADHAIFQYREAIRLDPDFAPAHNDLAAELASKPGHAQEAAAEYEAAIRLMPEIAEMHYNLANELVELGGRRQDAIRQYEEAIRLKPDFVQAHDYVAFAYEDSGRTEDAISHLQAALRLAPGDELARAELARLRQHGLATDHVPPKREDSH